MESLRFEMAAAAWTDAVIVFDDAQVKVHKSKLEPGKRCVARHKRQELQIPVGQLHGAGLGRR
jgi:hypothetical protein